MRRWRGRSESADAVTPIEIDAFQPRDQQGVLDLILPIQREKVGVAVALEDQPDLTAVPSFHQGGAGGFGVARCDGAVVGLIALKDIGGGQGALRKMFVAASHRGKAHGVAARLLDRLLREAQSAGIAEVFLGTTVLLHAAHRLYEKIGFTEIEREAPPARFPIMAVRSWRLTPSSIASR